ncbi:MAG: DinB family protein [bacterium]|nr:DinB family protein [bacterium]
MTTSREFFLETLTDETPRFERVLRAVPADNLDYRPDPRSRSALELASLFAIEPMMMNVILEKGVIEASSPTSLSYKNIDEIIKFFNAGIEATKSKVSAMTEEDWEVSAKMISGPTDIWETSKGRMVWSFFFDLIHHRGQLSVYLRPMGAKVPSIYGTSGDSEGER